MPSLFGTVSVHILLSRYLVLLMLSLILRFLRLLAFWNCSALILTLDRVRRPSIQSSNNFHDMYCYCFFRPFGQHNEIYFLKVSEVTPNINVIILEARVWL